MKNVLEYLENTAKKNKEKIEIIEEEKQCTYNKLLENSKKKLGKKAKKIIKENFTWEIIVNKYKEIFK